MALKPLVVTFLFETDETVALCWAQADNELINKTKRILWIILRFTLLKFILYIYHNNAFVMPIFHKEFIKEFKNCKVYTLNAE